MKLAVTGKGGVGKTTLTALMAATLAEDGRRVIALDADPDANLGSALGLSPEEQPVALADMKKLIAERTGTQSGYGKFFKLNPKVDDLPESHAAKLGNLRLLTLGGVSSGGGGCICPASALAKALLTHLVLGRDEHVLMDMEAGIEHLGRATAQTMDALVVVVDEGPWSLQTAQRIRKLAGDIGLKRLFVVANKLPSEASAAEIEAALDGVPLVGWLPHDERLAGGVARRAGTDDMVPSAVLKALQPPVRRILEQLRKEHSR
jgi:CO dehydrogenase maturation factor